MVNAETCYNFKSKDQIWQHFQAKPDQNHQQSNPVFCCQFIDR